MADVLSFEANPPDEPDIDVVVPEAPPPLLTRNGGLIADLLGELGPPHPGSLRLLAHASNFLARAASPAEERKAIAIADLGASGRRSRRGFAAVQPDVDRIVDQARKETTFGIDSSALRSAAERVLARATLVDRYVDLASEGRRALLASHEWRSLHGSDDSLQWSWIASGSELDLPTRPLQIGMTSAPQLDADVTVGDARCEIRYARSGRTDGPVVLILHGHSSSIEETVDLARELEGDADLWVPDLPSCAYSGRVDRPQGADDATPCLEFMDRFVDAFVRTVIRPARPDASIWVAGGSLGGNLTLRAGEAGHDWLRGILPWSPASVWRTYACVEDLGDFVSRTASLTTLRRLKKEQLPGSRREEYFDECFGRRVPTTIGGIGPCGHGDPLLKSRAQPDMWYRDGWRPKAACIEEARRFREEIYGETFRLWHWALAYEQLLSSHTHDCRARAGWTGGTAPGHTGVVRYRRIAVPTLLVSGAEDNLSFTNTADRVAEIGRDFPHPSSKVVVLCKTGHSIHNERPRFLAGLIRAFLAENP